MKTLHLIYGDDAETMQKVAADIRSKDASIDIGMRSAPVFVGKPEIETAGGVHVVGDYPEIKEAYDGLADVKSYAGPKKKAPEGEPTDYDPTFGENQFDQSRSKIDAARKYDQARAEGRIDGEVGAEAEILADEAAERAKDAKKAKK